MGAVPYAVIVKTFLFFWCEGRHDVILQEQLGDSFLSDQVEGGEGMRCLSEREQDWIDRVKEMRCKKGRGFQNDRARPDWTKPERVREREGDESW